MLAATRPLSTDFGWRSPSALHYRRLICYSEAARTEPSVASANVGPLHFLHRRCCPQEFPATIFRNKYSEKP